MLTNGSPRRSSMKPKGKPGLRPSTRTSKLFASIPKNWTPCSIAAPSAMRKEISRKPPNTLAGRCAWIPRAHSPTLIWGACWKKSVGWKRHVCTSATLYVLIRIIPTRTTIWLSSARSWARITRRVGTGKRTLDWTPRAPGAATPVNVSPIPKLQRRLAANKNNKQCLRSAIQKASLGHPEDKGCQGNVQEHQTAFQFRSAGHAGRGSRCVAPVRQENHRIQPAFAGQRSRVQRCHRGNCRSLGPPSPFPGNQGRASKQGRRSSKSESPRRGQIRRLVRRTRQGIYAVRISGGGEVGIFRRIENTQLPILPGCRFAHSFAPRLLGDSTFMNL